MEYVNAVTELNYMTQIVIMLYEDPTKVINVRSCSCFPLPWQAPHHLARVGGSTLIVSFVRNVKVNVMQMVVNKRGCICVN